MKINDKELTNPIIKIIIFLYLLPLIILGIMIIPFLFIYIIPVLILGFIDLNLQERNITNDN